MTMSTSTNDNDGYEMVKDFLNSFVQKYYFLDTLISVIVLKRKVLSFKSK